MRSYASTYRALDERGASILIALLFFLVCALVGGVVLTAASVGTGQLVDYEKSQQAYYSTTSAAELLRDEIVDGTCTISGDVYECSLADGNASMQEYLAGAVKAVNIALPAAALSTPQPSASAQFKVNAPVGAADMVAVSAQFTMGGEKANNPFDIRIAFSPASYDGAVGNYQVVLTIPASCHYDETGTTLQKVTWKDAMITKTERTKVDG